MAKMPKPAELRQWNDHELEVEMQKIERELFDLRSQSTTERIQAPSEIWNRKRQVARIRTILHQRSRVAATDAAAKAATDAAATAKQASEDQP